MTLWFEKIDNMGRKAPNFAQILTPYTASLTLDFFNARSQKQALEDLKENPAACPKVTRKGSTSQNHIISDFYIQETIEFAIQQVNKLEKSGGKQEKIRAKNIVNGLKSFILNIFSSKEQKEIKKAMICLEKRQSTLLGQLIASKGSNNAVEGNSSANSGIQQAMDAPTDTRGELLTPFKIMRDYYLDLAGCIVLNISDDKLKKTFMSEIVLRAISPNALGTNVIRASSRVYKYGDRSSHRSLSAPPSSPEKAFTREEAPQHRYSKKLTEAQKKNEASGLMYYRSRSIVSP